MRYYWVSFCCRRRTLTGRLSSSLTVYWCEHWLRRLLSDRVTLSHDSERKRTIYIGYTKRFACFCWVSVFDDEARFCGVSFCWVISFLLSQVRFCRVSFCWVSYLLTRRVIAETVLLSQFLLTRQHNVNIDRGAYTVAEGPRDAESWFRVEMYYIRILNVSPVFGESVYGGQRIFTSWWA